MKKSTVYLVGILIIFFLWVSFRSFMDGVDLYESFDYLASLLLREIWQLFSQPLVLISIAISILVLNYSDSIPNILPWLNKVELGPITLEGQLPQSVNHEVENQSLENEQALSEENQDGQDKQLFVTSPDQKYILFALGNEGITYKKNDFYTKIAEDILDLEKNDNDQKKFAGYGYLYSLSKNNARFLSQTVLYSPEEVTYEVKIDDEIRALLVSQIAKKPVTD